MRFFVLVLLTCALTCAHAQSDVATDSTGVDSGGQLSPYFIFKTGSVFRDRCSNCMFLETTSFAATAESGLRLGPNLSIGGGLGFTSFYWVHAVPVFGNINLGIGRKNQLIAGLKVGGAKIVKSSNGYRGYGLKEQRGGRLFEPYIGYMITYHDLRLYLLAGYLKQRFVSYYEYPNYYPLEGEYTEYDPSKRSVTVDMRRVSVTVGIGWK